MGLKTLASQIAFLLVLALISIRGVTAVIQTETELGPQASMFPLQTGWTTDLGHAPSAWPAYDALHAYVPLRDGSLIAVRLNDGTVAWHIEQPASFSPAAEEGTVVVAAGNKLTALRAVDAAALWSIDLGIDISTKPLLIKGWLIALLRNGDVVALRAADGIELWRLSLESSLLVSPSVGGTELFVPVTDGRIVAIDLITGKRLWEQKLNGSPQEILPLDALFVGATDNHFYRLSRSDGDIDWSWRTGGDIVGQPSVNQNLVFFLSLDNVLRALDRNSGAQRWRSILPNRPRSTPVIVDNSIVVSGVSPQLRTFEATSGKILNILEAPGELAAPPYMAKNSSENKTRMVLTIADGRLIGMQRAFGPNQLSLEFPPRPLLAEPPLRELADVQASGLLASSLSFLSNRPKQPAVNESVFPAFTVQVAALSSADAATDLTKKLSDDGFQAYIVDPSNNAAGNLYRIRVGYSLALPEAEQLALRLSREQGLETYIVTFP